MTSSTRPDHPTNARLTLATLGDAALCRSAPGAATERLLEVGKPLALVIYLACSNGRGALREHLIDLLWAHMDRERAQSALRQTIWQIKTRLGDDILTATRDRVSLVASIEVDRDAFLAASAAGDIDRVVSLYIGDFVTGFAAPGGAHFEHWADIERRALRGLFVRSAEEVVQQRLTSGHAQEALMVARRARDLDRLNQRAWRQVLECLIAAGDSVGAHVEADKLAHLLDDEEIEPDVATRVAVDDARATVNRTAEDSPPDLVAELIGREHEFATIMRAWDEIGRAQAKHFHIAATAGLGKTRFLTDLRNRLRAAGARAVYIRADFGARDIAYSFAGDVAVRLAKMRGAGGISPSSAGALIALNPSLSSVFSAERDVAVDDEALRRRTLALRELITTVADEHSVALLIDDLHWTDTLSFRALDAAIGGIERSRLLVVSAGRPTVDDGKRPTRATAINLTPLSREAVSGLVSSLANLPAEPWAARLPRALCDATGGSPLLILETLRLLIEQSLLIRSSDGWSAPDANAVFDALAQGSALRRRVESLELAEGSVLLLLAVSGRPLDRRILAEAAAASSIDDIAPTVTILEQRGLVLRSGDLLSVAHDEHGNAAIQAASADSVESAASAVGRALLAHAGNDVQKLCTAGSLLARGGDAQLTLMATAFERFVRAKRLDGDRRPDRVLAREFLGSATTELREGSLIRSLPWLVQARLVSRGRIAATIALMGICLFATVGAWTVLSRPEPRPDAILVATRLSADRATTELFPVPIDASHWAGISMLDVRLSGRPRWRIKVGQSNGRGDLRPDGHGRTEGRSVPDSGIIDIFDLGLDGTAKRLTFTRLDDYQPSWAPDNSRFVFTTSRWSKHGHYDLAIYDSLTHNVRHLTEGDDTDWEPRWSPDGARIAFIRQYAEGGQRGMCVIDADGDHLRCLPPEPDRALGLAGWADAHSVLLRRLAGEPEQLARFNFETGVTDLVDDRGAGAMISPDGRFGVCRCPRQGHPLGTWIVYPIERPNEFAVLHVVSRDSAAISFDWAPTTRRRPFVTGMKISVGLGQPVLGTVHQLRASGIDSAGNTVEAGVVRWRSEDTSVATIDSTGRLTPVHAGRVNIDASAGGWRSARETITVVEPTNRVLLDEDWSRDLEPTWRSFGDPRPRLVPNATLGHAFLNNGDESFFSGAYTSRPFDTRGGLWVDAELSTPITTSESSQGVVLWLFDIVDSTAWALWDHVTGDGPAGVSSPGWAFRYPQGVGGKHFGEQFVINAASGSHLFSAPPHLRSGRAFRLTMQIFPDGRCGLAIDGKVVWVGPADFFEPAVRLMLAGNSVGTNVLVGHLRILTGIAADVAWDGVAPAKKQTVIHWPETSARR